MQSIILTMGCNISSQNEVFEPRVIKIEQKNNFTHIQDLNNPENYLQIVIKAIKEQHEQIQPNQQQPTCEQNRTTYTYEAAINNRSSQYNPKSHLYPFNCIGTIFYKTQQGNQRCGLGFLISPRKVITALHVLKQYQKNGRNKLYFIIKDQNDNENVTMMSIIAQNNCSFQVESIKNNKFDKEEIHSSQDYCMLHLRKSVNRKSYIVLAHNFKLQKSQNTSYQATISNVQYQTNKIIHTINRGSLIQITKNEIFYDINTKPGQSGSPILIQLSKQIWVAIGFHTGHFSCNKFNSGCLFTKQIIQQFDSWSQDLQPFQKINRIKIPYHINKNNFNLIPFSPQELIAFSLYQRKSLSAQLKEYVDQTLSSSSADTIYKAANILYNLQLDRLSLLLCEYLVDVKKVKSNKLTNLLVMNYASINQKQYAIHLLAKYLPQCSKNSLDYVQTLNTFGTLLYSTNKKLAIKSFYQSARICSQIDNYSRVNIAISNIGLIRLHNNERHGTQLLIIQNIANNIKKLAQIDIKSNQRTIKELYRNLADIYKKIGRRDYEEIDCCFQQLIIQKNMWMKLNLFIKQIEKQTNSIQLSSRFHHFKKRQQQFCNLIRRKLPVNDLSFVITVIFMLDELLQGNQSKQIIQQRIKIIKMYNKTIQLSHSVCENSIH